MRKVTGKKKDSQNGEDDTSEQQNDVEPTEATASADPLDEEDAEGNGLDENEGDEDAEAAGEF